MSGNGDGGGQNYYGYDNAGEAGMRRQPSAPPADLIYPQGGMNSPDQYPAATAPSPPAHMSDTRQPLPTSSARQANAAAPLAPHQQSVQGQPLYGQAGYNYTNGSVPQGNPTGSWFTTDPAQNYGVPAPAYGPPPGYPVYGYPPPAGNYPRPSQDAIAGAPPTNPQAASTWSTAQGPPQQPQQTYSRRPPPPHHHPYPPPPPPHHQAFPPPPPPGVGRGPVPPEGTKRERALAAFRAFDVDGNGSLDVNEFVRAMQTLGVHLQLADAMVVFSIVDTKKNSIISREEFVSHYEANY
ncbi:hypothetical protein NDN08_002609 [Rhodosorus marinus]|uniref:EF-hand domain-containing protein n=1 Tax=Rhodosorus marinus TaxID=101924 RepID=A0AAV8UU72_9RHOD|nr:hypothetical protein NDN08_002609 [Rhodosorus marinus]